jgi:RNAse (barnase) inhibitor barstar
MRELLLDGSGWQKKGDVYDAFFAAVGAPQWHGRNFAALNDSIATGSINAVEVPYRIVIWNFDLIAGEARQMTDDFADLLRELQERGCPVEFEMRDSRGVLLKSSAQT